MYITNVIYVTHTISGYVSTGQTFYNTDTRSQTGAVFSSGPFLKLRFKTDGSVARQGFVALATTGLHLFTTKCMRIFFTSAKISCV
jgi:hypothetical protein